MKNLREYFGYKALNIHRFVLFLVWSVALAVVVMAAFPLITKKTGAQEILESVSHLVVGGGYSAVELSLCNSDTSAEKYLTKIQDLGWENARTEVSKEGFCRYYTRLDFIITGPPKIMPVAIKERPSVRYVSIVKVDVDWPLLFMGEWDKGYILTSLPVLSATKDEDPKSQKKAPAFESSSEEGRSL